jgi:hypothetical protein
MPILEVSDEEALKNYWGGANRYCRWYDNGCDLNDANGRLAVQRRNRATFTPQVRIRTRVPLQSKFFAVGSCFAREIEAALGFKLKQEVLSLWAPGPDLHSYRNRFHTAAIADEMAWALGDEVFPEAGILRYQGCAPLCVDLHSHPCLPFADFDETVGRRAVLSADSAKVVDADVVIVTLGLTEAWFDHETQHYLNVAPLFGDIHPHDLAIRENPKRFTFRVMNFQENMDNLERLFATLQKHLRRGFRIIVTTSPIPLRATFSNRDVVEANTYSKAVLRVCAEEWRRLHPETIDYFPSFEMVMNSDPKQIWDEDGIHVKRSFVEQIMAHFVATCLEPVAHPEMAMVATG